MNFYEQFCDLLTLMVYASEWLMIIFKLCNLSISLVCSVWWCTNCKQSQKWLLTRVLLLCFLIFEIEVFCNSFDYINCLLLLSWSPRFLHKVLLTIMWLTAMQYRYPSYLFLIFRAHTTPQKRMEEIHILLIVFT